MALGFVIAKEDSVSDLLARSLLNISSVKTVHASAKPVLKGGQPIGLEIIFETSDGSPGVEIPCPNGIWNFSMLKWYVSWV